MQRELPLLPKLYFTVCDVRDVAAAHIQAMLVPEAAGDTCIESALLATLVKWFE